MPVKRKKVLAVATTEEVLSRLTDIATKDDRSISFLIHKAIEEWLENHPENTQS
ncbi:MAG: hypothetical protein LBQ83_01875 [Candidatus Margulisbacteria bacterium]|jgi:predicted transcriptional regulator|nr:hypothetical protein [Candidatus Margulisiibacteriota bacterium]